MLGDGKIVLLFAVDFVSAPVLVRENRAIRSFTKCFV